MLLIVLKLPYYASIMLDALELCYAQNYAGIIRQGLTRTFFVFVSVAIGVGFYMIGALPKGVSKVPYSVSEQANRCEFCHERSPATKLYCLYIDIAFL